MYFNLNICKKTTTKQNKINKPFEALKANTIPIQLGDFIIHCLPLKLLNTHTYLLQCQKFIGLVWNKLLASELQTASVLRTASGNILLINLPLLSCCQKAHNLQRRRTYGMICVDNSVFEKF